MSITKGQQAASQKVPFEHVAASVEKYVKRRISVTKYPVQSVQLEASVVAMQPVKGGHVGSQGKNHSPLLSFRVLTFGHYEGRGEGFG